MFILKKIYTIALLFSTSIGFSAPIHVAARDGSVAVLQAELDRGVSVDDVNAAGWTPLHFAAMYGRIETVRLLLTHGANIKAKNGMGNTALQLAVLNGHLGVVAALLNAGAVFATLNIQIEGLANPAAAAIQQVLALPVTNLYLKPDSLLSKSLGKERLAIYRSVYNERNDGVIAIILSLSTTQRISHFPNFLACFGFFGKKRPALPLEVILNILSFLNLQDLPPSKHKDRKPDDKGPNGGSGFGSRRAISF